MPKIERKPLISIVVLNHNGLMFLRQTLPPLLKLKYPNYEVLVVDNGSTDGSLDFLQRNKVNIIDNKKNLGYSAGKNIGVESAKGEFVLLLDEDVEVTDTEILSKLLDEHLHLDRVAFLSVVLIYDVQKNTTFYGGYHCFYGVLDKKPIKIEDIQKLAVFQTGSPEGGAIFFKKKIFIELDGYDTSQPYNLDVADLGVRAMLMGYKNFMYSRSVFLHHGEKRKKETASWCWKYSYNFSGVARGIIKNYHWTTLLIALPMTFSFFILKTVKQFSKRKKICVLKSFGVSVIYFLKSLKITILQRKKIQSRRLIKEDVFLKLRPPVFN